jgi:hypothetical protein
VSPNGGLKAASSPPQKQHSEHRRQKEVNSTGWSYTLTCELDLLCTAVVVELAANLIYFSREKKYVEEKNTQKKFRKDSTKRGHQRELARKGRPRSQLRVPICGGMSTQPTRIALKRGT